MGGEVMNLHVEGGGLTNGGEAIMEGGGNGPRMKPCPPLFSLVAVDVALQNTFEY